MGLIPFGSFYDGMGWQDRFTRVVLGEGRKVIVVVALERWGEGSLAVVRQDLTELEAALMPARIRRYYCCSGRKGLYELYVRGEQIVDRRVSSYPVDDPIWWELADSWQTIGWYRQAVVEYAGAEEVASAEDSPDEPASPDDGV